MAKGTVNKIMLIGVCGREPETKTVGQGVVICKFSIATKETNKDKTEHVEWHNITMFGKLAEIAQQYVKKGDKVYVSGKVRSNKYTGKDGVERTTYEIVADEMQMLSERGAQTTYLTHGGVQRVDKAATPAPAPAAQVALVDEFNDDIPF